MNSYYPVQRPLEEEVFSTLYSETERIELIQRLKAWAKDNMFVLVVSKNDKDRIYLRCKLGQKCRTRVKESDRVRSRTSLRQECPFILRITKSQKNRGQLRLKAQNQSKHEHVHNHPLSVLELQTIPEGKRSVVSKDTVKLVSSMFDASNSIADIRKAIGTQARLLLSYDDIRNWREEYLRMAKTKSSTSTDDTPTDSASAAATESISLPTVSPPPDVIRDKENDFLDGEKNEKALT